MVKEKAVAIFRGWRVDDTMMAKVFGFVFCLFLWVVVVCTCCGSVYICHL